MMFAPLRTRKLDYCTVVHYMLLAHGHFVDCEVCLSVTTALIVKAGLDVLT